MHFAFHGWLEFIKGAYDLLMTKITVAFTPSLNLAGIFYFFRQYPSQ